MTQWYRKDGSPIEEGNWQEIEKLLSDRSYKIIAQERCPHAGHMVSTVWIGLSLAPLRSSKPLIFETMVFSIESWEGEQGMAEELDCERYATEEEAREGHKRMIAKWDYIMSDL